MTDRPLCSRFDLAETRKEADKFREVYEEVRLQWEQECLRYEQADGTKMPTRNYTSWRQQVKDVSLFPYHDSCYALIDAYDNVNDEHAREGVMPCSEAAIHSVFVDDSCRLPGDPFELGMLLCRILKHALSEIQRDYKLAHAAICFMRKDRLLRYKEVFQQLLIVVFSEFITCDGDCERGTCDHECEDVILFYSELEVLIDNGVEQASYDFTATIYFFVFFIFDLEYGHLHRGNSSSSKHNELKRNFVAIRSENEDRDELDRVPRMFLGSIIEGIVAHINTWYFRMCAESSQEQRGDIDIFHILQCVRCLVSIAEASVAALPPGQRFSVLRSQCLTVVARLLGGLTETLPDPPSDYFGVRYKRLLDVRLAEPFRYVDIITGNSGRIGMHSTRDESFEEYVSKALIENFQSDIQDLAYACFMLEYTMPKEVQFGYGDFVVWCGLDLVPSLLLECHHAAFPSRDAYESDLDSEDDDSMDSFYDWDYDMKEDSEENCRLSRPQMVNINSFSVLCLHYTWMLPWSPETHHSFPAHYRQAAKCVALCIKRLCLPSELTRNLLEFLPRQWWDDSRLPCWYDNCESERTLARMEQKVLGSPPREHSSGSRVHCPYCVATYCCKRCWNADKRHRMACFNRKKSILCTEVNRCIEAVRKTHHDKEPHPVAELMASPEHENESEGNSDGDWSSVDTEAEEEAARLSPYFRTVQEAFDYLETSK